MLTKYRVGAGERANLGQAIVRGGGGESDGGWCPMPKSNQFPNQTRARTESRTRWRS